MIQMQTMLDVADNSGAKKICCINLLGGSKGKYAGVGDIITASVKEASPDGNVKKGQVIKAVIVRTVSAHRRRHIDECPARGELRQHERGELEWRLVVVDVTVWRVQPTQRDPYVPGRFGVRGLRECALQWPRRTEHEHASVLDALRAVYGEGESHRLGACEDRSVAEHHFR